MGRHVGYVVGTDAATGAPGDPHLRRPARGGRALRPRHQARRPRRPTGGRLGRDQPGRRPARRLGRVRRRREDPAPAAGQLLRDDVPRRQGRAARPVRPRRAGRPGDGARRVRRGGAGRARRAPAADRRRRSAPRTGSARSTSASSTSTGLGVPQRVRRLAGRRRRLRLADRPDDAGLVHPDHPVAQGRADADPRRPARHGSPSTRSCSRAARSARGPTRRPPCTPAPARRPTTRASTPAAGSRSSSGPTRSRPRSGPPPPLRPARSRWSWSTTASADSTSTSATSPIPVAGVHRDAGAALDRAGPQGHAAHADAGRVPGVRLRPDPRLPGPGAGPADGLPAEPARPREDRRALLRRQAVRLERLPVRRHAQPVPRVRGAGAAPGDPGRVGDAGPAVGRVARPGHRHRRCYWPMVSGVTSYDRGETARLDWFRPTIRPSSSDSFGVYNSRWQNYMTWNVQAWSSFSDRLRPRRVPAVGRDADAPAGLPGRHADRRQPVQRRHAVGGGAGRATSRTGSSSTPSGRPTSSGCRPGPTPQWTFMSDTVRGGRLRAVLGAGPRLPPRDRPARRRPRRREAADLGPPGVHGPRDRARQAQPRSASTSRSTVASPGAR